MRIKEAVAVKAYELANQLAEGCIRRSLDRCADSTKEGGKFARPERDLGDNAHAATRHRL